MRGIERADRWPLAQARFSAHEALSCRIGAQAKARSSHVGRPFTRSVGGHLAQNRTPDRPDRTEYSGRDPLLEVTTTVRDNARRAAVRRPWQVLGARQRRCADQVVLQPAYMRVGIWRR